MPFLNEQEIATKLMGWSNGRVVLIAVVSAIAGFILHAFLF